MADPHEAVLAHYRGELAQMTWTCERCDEPLGGTYWFLEGSHYCEACADVMRLNQRPAAWTFSADLVWERLPSGEMALLRPS